jgi:hypothetical protein
MSRQKAFNWHKRKTLRWGVSTSGLSLRVKDVGPIAGELRLELDVPVTILTGETGTGKSFLLRLLSMLLRELRQPLDARALESELMNEFGHPRHIVHEGAGEGEVELSYEDDVLVGLRVRERPIGFGGPDKLRAEFVEIEKERGGSQPYAELASRSLMAPDERVPLVKQVLLKGHYYYTTPSTDAYCSLLAEMRIKNHWLLEEMLAPLIEEGLIPRVRSYFDRGLVAGHDAHMASSAALSLISLAPIAYRLSEGRALLVAVDTVELHLTPLLQAATAVDLARRAKKCWEESEEYPIPLLLVTHSSIVLSALLTEVEEGAKNKLVRLGEEYRLKSEDVKTVILYRKDGIVNYDVTQGITQPSYLREYARFL